MTNYQKTLDGRTVPLGTQMGRLRCIMESDEGCRNNDMETIVIYWMDEGLRYILDPAEHDKFVSYMATEATPAKSLLNRIQDNRRLFSHLAPSPDVAEKRGRG